MNVCNVCMHILTITKTICILYIYIYIRVCKKICIYILSLSYRNKAILVNELGRHYVVAFVQDYSASCSQADAVGTGREN